MERPEKTPDGRDVRGLEERYKKEDDGIVSKNNEIRWEIKRFERGKTGEDIRREGGEMVGIKI